MWLPRINHQEHPSPADPELVPLPPGVHPRRTEEEQPKAKYCRLWTFGDHKKKWGIEEGKRGRKGGKVIPVGQQGRFTAPGTEVPTWSVPPSATLLTGPSEGRAD